MTTSRDDAGLPDLARDLPTTEADVEALRTRQRRSTLQEYLRFLASLPPASHQELRARRKPAGDRRFELPP